MSGRPAPLALRSDGCGAAPCHRNGRERHRAATWLETQSTSCVFVHAAQLADLLAPALMGLTGRTLAGSPQHEVRKAEGADLHPAGPCEGSLISPVHPPTH
jgi:hypothetical protein